MGGTQLRDMVADGQKERFISKLPSHLNRSELENAWEIVTSGFNDVLNGLIDSTIEEMSSMAGGDVEGAPGGFGSGKSNKFNPWRR